MGCSSTAVHHHHLLAWSSTSLLQQKDRTVVLIKHPHFSRACHWCSNDRRSTTSWLLPNPFSLVLKGSEGRPSSNVVAHAGRSPRRREHRPSIGRNQDPVGNTRKEKPSNTHEPYTRHSDEYYKFGPYGPYAYKAPVVGKLLPVTNLSQSYVFTWSTVQDLKEQEELNMYNACVRYDNRVKTFDEKVGLQFFYVFVRLPYYVGPEPPWKQWTLIAEITIESAEDLDKDLLALRLNSHIKNKITTYTGWFRPDLVYVKPSRRRYQIRFEPEMDFLRELRSLLLESAGEPNEVDSYYGQFCKVLGLNVDASHEEVTSKYEESPKEIQLACLEHLLTKHPVELLHPVRYPNRKVWLKEQKIEETDTVSASCSIPEEPTVGVVDQEGDSNVQPYGEDDAYLEIDEEEDSEGETDDWDDLDDPEIHAKMSKSFLELQEEEKAMFNRSDADDYKGNDIDSEDDELEEKEHDISGGDAVAPSGETILKAATRPYNYVNFIREMVMLREMLVHEKRSLQQVQEGQA